MKVSGKDKIYPCIIPVVMGGLFKNDYENLAPPHSYIHVDDFDSVDDLIRYLGQCDQIWRLYEYNTGWGIQNYSG